MAHNNHVCGRCGKLILLQPEEDSAGAQTARTGGAVGNLVRGLLGFQPKKGTAEEREALRNQIRGDYEAKKAKYTAEIQEKLKQLSTKTKVDSFDLVGIKSGLEKVISISTDVFNTHKPGCLEVANEVRNELCNIAENEIKNQIIDDIIKDQLLQYVAEKRTWDAFNGYNKKKK